MKLEDLKANRRAQVYAMIAWNGMSMDEAIKVVESAPFDVVDEKVYSKDSVVTAASGVNFYKDKFSKVEHPEDLVVLICDQIHKKWVSGNAKKYDRGNPEKSEKKIYQHLPTQLIGMSELCLDAMFLAPFLDDIGIHIGDMGKEPYAAFVPTKEFVEAYNRYVEKYKNDNNITNDESLKNVIAKEIEQYEPLAITDNVKTQERHDYMVQHIDTLLTQTKEKNPGVFKGQSR